MKPYKTIEETHIAYFSEHPDEIDAFIQEAFSDYGEDGDSAALLSALRLIARVKGITETATTIGMTRQGLQKALSPNGNPRLDNISAIMRSFGYQLMPQRLEASTP